MIKKIFILFFGFMFTYSGNIVEFNIDNNVITINEVDNLMSVSKDNFDVSKVGEIYYSNINEDKKNISVISNENGVSINTIILGKYFYKTKENFIGEGLMLGTSYTPNSKLFKMIKDTVLWIETSNITSNYYNLESNSISSISVGDSWNQKFSTRITMSLDYDNIHYGDYLEWFSGYDVSSKNFNYYLLTHESYITPNSNNTDDFRSSKLIFKTSPTGETLYLRNYEPKAKNPETSISYGIDLSTEIDGNRTGKISAAVSSTYQTILTSPKIHDRTNMANDNLNIEFEYLNAWSEDEPFHTYNIETSMQTTSYIYRQNKNKDIANILEERTIQMIRDDFWPWNDKTISFIFDFTHKLKIKGN